MKVVILAGGLGTRLSEETVLKPKPMVEIGGMPILWHIMKSYSAHGFNDFVICLGYKGYVVKEYFVNYLGEVVVAATVEDVVEIVAEETNFSWKSGGFSNCYSTGHTNLAVMVAIAMGSMQWGQSTERSLGSWEGIVVNSREGNCIDLACRYFIYEMK